MKFSAVIPIFLTIGLFFLTNGCTAPVVEDDAGKSPKIKVIASIFPLADIIENIGGDTVEVTVLLHPGDSPHTFEPTVEQARAVSRADILFFIGEGLDDWAVGLAGPESIRTVQITNQMQGWILSYPPVHPGEAEDDHQHPGEDDQHPQHSPHDPHVWTDPILIQEIIAPLVAEKLTEAAPQYASTIAGNLAEFQTELQVLHQQITVMVKDFSAKRYISYHSAWNYFARRYGLEEVAAVEEFPGQEPSAKWLIELVSLAEEHRINIVFAEPQLSQKAAGVIANEIGGRVLFLDPLGGKGLPGRDSYLELIRYNAELFQEALR